MNTTFPETEIGKLITVKLDEYEKSNDPDALKQQALILKIFTVAKVILAIAVFIGFVSGCIASAVTFSWAPFLVSLGITVTASAIVAVFYRVMNLREIYSYDLLKRVKDNWGSSSVEQDLRILTIDAEGYLEEFKRMNEKGPYDALSKWIDTLSLDFRSDSYKMAKFLGIPFEVMHENLLSLSSEREQEVRV